GLEDTENVIVTLDTGSAVGGTIIANSQGWTTVPTVAPGDTTAQVTNIAIDDTTAKIGTWTASYDNGNDELTLEFEDLNGVKSVIDVLDVTAAVSYNAHGISFDFD